MNQPAPIEFVYLFEYGSYLSWLFLVGFFFFYKKERIVQWFIIAMTLSGGKGLRLYLACWFYLRRSKRSSVGYGSLR